MALEALMKKMEAQEEQIEALEKERDALRAALEEIRDQDYRGNRCSCSQLAFKILNKKD